MASILPPDLIKRGWQTLHDNVEGLVPGNGSLTPRFILVGEAPGETEVTTHKPFTGRAGVELDKSLSTLGVTREEVFITSAYRSRPFRIVTKTAKRTGQTYQKKDNRPPTQHELISQAFLIDYELAHLPTDLILTIGNVGLKRLLGPKYRVGDVHGQFFRVQFGVMITSSKNLCRLSDITALCQLFIQPQFFTTEKLKVT